MIVNRQSGDMRRDDASIGFSLDHDGNGAAFDARLESDLTAASQSSGEGV